MEKIKVHIYTDKAYPVYYIDYPIDREIDWKDSLTSIDESLYQKYIKAKKAWDEVQAELKAIY